MGSSVARAIVRRVDGRVEGSLDLLGRRRWWTPRPAVTLGDGPVSGAAETRFDRKWPAARAALEERGLHPAQRRAELRDDDALVPDAMPNPNVFARLDACTELFVGNDGGRPLHFPSLGRATRQHEERRSDHQTSHRSRLARQGSDEMSYADDMPTRSLETGRTARGHFGGGGEIRTPGGLPHGGFQNRCLRPLGHSSEHLPFSRFRRATHPENAGRREGSVRPLVRARSRESLGPRAFRELGAAGTLPPERDMAGRAFTRGPPKPSSGRALRFDSHDGAETYLERPRKLAFD